MKGIGGGSGETNYLWAEEAGVTCCDVTYRQAKLGWRDKSWQKKEGNGGDLDARASKIELKTPSEEMKTYSTTEKKAGMRRGETERVLTRKQVISVQARKERDLKRHEWGIFPRTTMTKTKRGFGEGMHRAYERD